MAGSNKRGLRQQREIPDPHIRDAANQYYEASMILHAMPPHSGVLHPTINTSAVAIELYLKALSAFTAYTEDGNGFIVNAKAKGRHLLTAIAKNIPCDVKEELDTAFLASGLIKYGTLDVILGRLNNTFMESRYPFEDGDNVRRYDLGLMKDFPRFLAEFVRDCRVRFYLQQEAV